MDFTFAVGSLPRTGRTRDLIMVATGRNEPDYKVHSGLLPDKVELYPNYPNPFNPVTSIGYFLPRDAEVRLDVYNLAGQVVATLVNHVESRGLHRIDWRGTSSSGRQLASGLYLYRLKADGELRTRKMLLLK